MKNVIVRNISLVCMCMCGVHSTVLNSFAHVRTYCAVRDKSRGNEVILDTASADSWTLFMENVLLYLRENAPESRYLSHINWQDFDFVPFLILH